MTTRTGAKLYKAARRGRQHEFWTRHEDYCPGVRPGVSSMDPLEDASFHIPLAPRSRTPPETSGR